MPLLTRISGKQRRYSRQLLAAVSVIVLSGCVSAINDDMEMTQSSTAPALTGLANTDTAQNTPKNTGYRDPMVAASADGATQNQEIADLDNGNAVSTEAPGDLGAVVMQPTRINAGASSIFSAQAPQPVAVDDNEADGGSTTAPAYVPVPGINPSLNSVYSAPQTQLAPEPETSGTQNASQNAAPPSQPTEPQKIAGLPAAVPPAASSATSFAPIRPGTAKTSSIFYDDFDDSYEEEDSEPVGLMKLASLSGLSRVSPNGLFLQTDRVETSCFKPELIKVIKAIEAYYHRPAIITSGYRAPKGPRSGSKHTTCEAADIQIQGVSKWELATYLRSLPGRGGVGTYCHTESVHVDIGEPRDWNWRCRKTKKN